MENQSSSASKPTWKPEELKKYIDDLVAQRVQEELEKTIAHDCFTCKWFQLSKTPPRNRYCQHPDPCVLKGGVCQLWELEPDPQMRNRGFC